MPAWDGRSRMWRDAQGPPRAGYPPEVVAPIWAGTPRMYPREGTRLLGGTPSRGCGCPPWLVILDFPLVLVPWVDRRWLALAGWSPIVGPP